MSSHIHGEGEYINFINGYELIKNIPSALLLAGGIVHMALKSSLFNSFEKVNGVLIGDSEETIVEIADLLESKVDPITSSVQGVYWNGIPDSNFKIRVLNGTIGTQGKYDYSIFDSAVLTRPYCGSALRAVDYEISRGCPFTCTYCVETVIQQTYGFTDINELGV